MNLTRFDQDGLELFVANNGSVFANQNALARMCGVSKQAISKWCSVNQAPTLSAEVETDAGLRSVKLLDEEAIKVALLRYNPVLAGKCMDAGLRVFLHGLAGYQPQAQSIAPQKSKSLLDLSSTELWALIVRRELVDTGKNLPVSINDKFDPAMLEASLGAVLYAFFQKIQQETDLSELTERMEGAPSAKGFGKPSKNEKQIASTRKLITTMGDQRAEFEAFERSMQSLEGTATKVLSQ
jgi:hypothetical protein